MKSVTARIRIVIYVITTVILWIGGLHTVRAANVTLSPTQIVAPVNYAFFVDLDINTGQADILGVDVAINYDPTILYPISAQPTPLFSNVYLNYSSSGNIIYIRAANDKQSQSFNGFGEVSKVVFRGIRPGITNISFSCQPSNRNDTNIWDATNKDIVDCSKVAKTVVSVIITDEQGRMPGDIPPITFPPGEPSCDLCGVCKQKDGSVTVPSNWRACRQCMYNDDGSVREGWYWTPLGCLRTTPGFFVSIILRFMINIGSGIAFLLFLYGGYLILTSRGDKKRLFSGKRLITATGASLLILLFAVFLLRLIGINLLGLPGFG